MASDTLQIDDIVKRNRFSIWQVIEIEDEYAYLLCIKAAPWIPEELNEIEIVALNDINT